MNGFLQKNEKNPPIKYSLYEIERRFLVPALPDDAVEPVSIEDKYLTGTRIRLRKMDYGKGETVHKLTKKYGDREGASESIATLYLEPHEFCVFDALDGDSISKKRFSCSDSRTCYDLFQSGLVISEVNFVDTNQARSFVPNEAWIEVTGDPKFSGRQLAATETR